MTGHFELVTDSDGACRARLLDNSGKVLAVSEHYGDIEAAARGIFTIREIAASGLIEDTTHISLDRSEIPTSARMQGATVERLPVRGVSQRPAPGVETAPYGAI